MKLITIEITDKQNNWIEKAAKQKFLKTQDIVKIALGDYIEDWKSGLV